MAQIPLVELQIQGGQRLVNRLARESVPLTAAFWALEAESGEWYLYLATPLVTEADSTELAYRRVLPIIREMQKEGIGIESVNVKAIGPHDPIARDVLATRDRHPTRTAKWFRGARLGDLAVDVAYIY